jgi:hypothetical protein
MYPNQIGQVPAVRRKNIANADRNTSFPWTGNRPEASRLPDEMVSVTLTGFGA